MIRFYLNHSDDVLAAKLEKNSFTTRTWNSGQTFPAKLSVYGGSYPSYPASNLADITAGTFWHSAEDSLGSATYRQDRKFTKPKIFTNLILYSICIRK